MNKIDKCKDAALYSYLVLEKLGVDFMILEDEGCCAKNANICRNIHDLIKRYTQK